MSEEYVKPWLLFLTLPALLAAAPAPLVVGVVRDQYGSPIAGAQVTAGSTLATTDVQGTFALNAQAASVTISCDYCLSLMVSVAPNEPVIAIVHRYDAIAQDTPSDRDIASAPYSRAEYIASLRPFTVLENSSRVLPGARLSDRGASPRGMLVLDGGIPLYDVASDETPFVAFPSHAVRQIATRPPSDAFLYGDYAGGGTLQLDTHTTDAYGGTAAAGSSSSVQAMQTLGNNAWSAAISHDPDDNRARGDAGARIANGDDAFDLRAFLAQDAFAPASESVNTSLGGARLAFESARENTVDASVTADGGRYDGTSSALRYSAKWSDVQAQSGVHTNARVQFFTGAAVRISSGSYSTTANTLPLVSGAISQTRVDMGAQTAGERYELRAGIGAFDVHYGGGASGAHTALDGGAVIPGVFGSYAFTPHWSIQMQGGGSFVLPTILETFVSPPDGPGLKLDRNSLLEATLRYADLRRFHVDVTALDEHLSGLDNGTIQSAGISTSWQVTPVLSLRAWLLHENANTQPYEPLYRFGTLPKAATVGSYWLTYESSGLRVDAIYRRDLLDYSIDPHFDASLSAPIAPEMRVFAATEQIAGKRSVTIGVRVQPQ
jgi:hypothetical protein